MSARRFSATLLFCVSAFLALLNFARAQDITPPEVENSKYQFAGVVNSNAVFVRSGPSENDYATMKLDKSAEVKVVGLRFDWLKVVPPEGSFCYVAKAFIDRRGAGNVGRVTQTLNVRVGSQLNELKAKIAAKLEPGVDVEIVGEEQEYFKIKPPAGVFFYINKQYVDPVRQIQIGADGKEVSPAVADGQTPNPDSTTQSPAPDSSAAVSTTTTPPLSSGADMPPIDSTAMSPATQPSGNVAARTEMTSPATQPAVADAEAEFDRLEAEYAQASLKPLEEQPVIELLEGYKKLASSDGLPESLRRIAEFKSQVLQTRMEAKAQLVEVKKVHDDMKQKQMALKSEKEEIEQRIKETEISFYTAVGTLRPSSLQMGSQTLFRLTDPANGRTVVYLRTEDAKVSGMIGQFVGVKGDVAMEAALNLRVIAPTSCELVNPAKVGQSIAAQIVPPSLLPGGAQANTNPEE